MGKTKFGRISESLDKELDEINKAREKKKKQVYSLNKFSYMIPKSVYWPKIKEDLINYIMEGEDEE